jgi:hypothetical protein
VVAQAGGVPCFIEDLVVLSRDGRPATATLRNTRLVATGRLGQVKQWAIAHHVAHEADAAMEAPTPPSTGRAWVPPRKWGPAAVPLASRAARLVEGLARRLVS